MMVIKELEKDPALYQKNQHAVLELRGKLLLMKGNYAEALPFYLEYAKKVDATDLS